jgi:hypothetical protein
MVALSVMAVVGWAVSVDPGHILNLHAPYDLHVPPPGHRSRLFGVLALESEPVDPRL